MDISNLKKEIKITFDSLADQVDTITNSNDRIPQIELDIAMGNIRKLYEDFYVLNKQNQAPPAGRKAEAEPKKEEIEEHFSKTEPVKQAPAVEIKEEPQQIPNADKAPEPKKEVNKEKPEPEPKTRQQDPSNKIQEDNKAKESATQKAKLPEDPKRTADLFSSSQSTIADKFMNGQDKSLGTRMQKNKINDLKSAIGINQKFIFLNELFDGDMQEYNKSIDQLNSFSTRDQAMAVLGALKNRHNWDEENEAYHQFVNMIERRFGNE